MGIADAVDAAGEKAQYDEQAKKLLGNKLILAHILIKTVKEFHRMNPKDVVPLIEGEPKIGVVPLDAGLTNAEYEEGDKSIVGMNTEDSEINEGMVRFDIIFYVRMRDGLSQMIINIEAQKDEPLDYSLIDRAVFYACRMVSSQKGRDFQGMNYSDIKRVYSIWICMNMEENTLDHIHLTRDNLLGKYDWGGKLDMLNVVVIGLSKELPEKAEDCELHRLLGTLLSSELNASQKLGIMETEYDIPIDRGMGKEVASMCNLSEGVWELGMAKGMAKGKAEMIINLLEDCGEVPQGLKEIIYEQRDIAVLKQWAKLAARAESVEEFESALGLVK